MSMLRKKFLTDSPGEPKYEVGSYVRCVGKDLGTGQIIAIHEITELNRHTQQVTNSRGYTVFWLTMNQESGGLASDHPETELERSARSVPKMQTLEEAQAWLESQATPGNWVAGAQDSADSSSDIDVALQKLLDEET